MGGKMKQTGNVFRFFTLISLSVYVLGGYAAFAETTGGATAGVNLSAPSGNTAPQTVTQTQPTIDYPSAVLERAGSGLANVAYGPLEVIYNVKEEIKRTDPLRGLIPGLGKGTGWLVTREAVGVFELVTCFLPYKPVLKKFDTDWIYL